MLKYAWLLTALTLLACHFNDVASRTASGAAQQQLNAITQQPQSQEAHTDTNIDSGSTAVSSSLWHDATQAYRIYKQCAQDNISVCLKVKLLTGLEHALRSAKILKILEGVQFVQSSGSTDDDGAQSTKTVGFTSEKELEAVLPRGTDAKEQVLNSMIIKKLASFLQEHTLQVKFPDLRSAQADTSGNSVESRKKKDKKGGGGGAMIMIPLLLGGTFIPIAYGALAMLAGKALIVSKLALVLASIIGIKKLLSSGGKESQHEVVVSSGGHSGWGRDMDLAYSGWKPAKDNTKNIGGH